MLIKSNIYYLILSSFTILITVYSNKFISEYLILDNVITNCDRPIEGNTE